MAFENIDALPLGKLLQPKQDSKLGKKRKKKLSTINKMRAEGYK